MTEALFGIPTNETIANTGMAPQALKFSQWLESVFQPVGYNGAPNPSTDPMECYQYLNNRRTVIQQTANQEPLVRIFDKDLHPIATIGDYLHCEIEELMADSGKAKCVIRFDNWLTNWIINENSIFADIHLIVDPIPTKPNWRTRWGGKITEISIKNNEDGSATVELQAIANREHCKRLLFAANPIFSPEIQLPQMWILPGPTRSVLFLSMFINLARLFVPGLSFITNAFNPAAWLNPLSPNALSNINPLSWPLQVAFVNPITDQSQWTALGAAWTDWHSSMNDILGNSGVVCRAYTFLTTDEDSPYTELVDLITGATQAGVDLLDLLGLGSADELVSIVGNDIASLARPTRNCVVFSLEDQSGTTGPTGTALDGLLSTIAVTGDDLITASLIELPTGETLNGETIIDANSPTDPVIQSLLGVAPPPPKVIWREGEFNGMLSSEVDLHKAPVLTVMTGGRSPSIVNEAQTFGIKYGLSQLQLVFAAGGGLGGVEVDGPAPVGAGLDNLYQGQLDNVLLAWERYTDPIRALWTGDLAFQEYFERGSSTAYTLAGFLTLAEANYKTRPFYGFQTQIRNGYPWAIDIDTGLGQRAGFEMGNIIYVDQITAVKRVYDRTTPRIVSLSIGDDRDKHNPVSQVIRTLSAIYMTLGAFLGEGTIFG